MKIKTQFTCPACDASSPVIIRKPGTLDPTIICSTCLKCRSILQIKFLKSPGPSIGHSYKLETSIRFISLTDAARTLEAESRYQKGLPPFKSPHCPSETPLDQFASPLELEAIAMEDRLGALELEK